MRSAFPRKSASLFGAADTILGPVYLGWGIAEGGRNTFFFSEQSNKYFDSWTSLVGADGYTPIAGSPLLGAASFAGWTGFDTVTYIGAFDGSNNWMSGWTNFDPQNAKY